MERAFKTHRWIKGLKGLFRKNVENPGPAATKAVTTPENSTNTPDFITAKLYWEKGNFYLQYDDPEKAEILQREIPQTESRPQIPPSLPQTLESGHSWRFKNTLLASAALAGIFSISTIQSLKRESFNIDKRKIAIGAAALTGAIISYQLAKKFR